MLLMKTLYDVQLDGRKQRKSSPRRACQVLDRKQYLLKETMGVQETYFLVGFFPSLKIILLSASIHISTG